MLGFFFKIGYSARKLLRHMMHKATFLSYRPSQIASTAILVAIDLNKAEGEVEKHQYEQMCQAQVTSPRRRGDMSFTSSAAKMVNSPTSPSAYHRKFNSMLNGCEEQELRMTSAKAAISPPSHSNYCEPASPRKSQQPGGGDN